MLSSLVPEAYTARLPLSWLRAALSTTSDSSPARLPGRAPVQIGPPWACAGNGSEHKHMQHGDLQTYARPRQKHSKQLKGRQTCELIVLQIQQHQVAGSAPVQRQGSCT